MTKQIYNKPRPSDQSPTYCPAIIPFFGSNKCVNMNTDSDSLGTDKVGISGMEEI